MKHCRHTEAVLIEAGRPDVHLPNDKHSCSYVDERNALIPEAEALAFRAADAWAQSRPGDMKASRGDTAYRMQWSREFFAAMDFLWASRATRKTNAA